MSSLPARVVTRYALEPNVICRDVTDGVELWHSLTGHRCVAKGVTYDQLTELLEEDRAGRAPLLEGLVGRGMLVTAAQPATVEIPRGFGNLPAVSMASVLRERPADALVLGVPYEGGGLAAPGARLGPDVLRLHAWDHRWQVDPDTWGVTGMFDLDEDRYLFDGARVFDLGNLGSAAELGRGSRAEVLASLQHAVACIVEAGTLPVVIGGDHSLTAAAIDGCAGVGPFDVVQIDAHADDSGPSAEPPSADAARHDDFMGFVRSRPHVRHVTQLGLRIADPTRRPPGVVQTSWRRTRDWHPGDEQDDVPCYVTIDVDAIDPIFLPNTGTCLPGGLTPDEVVDLLARIASRRRVIGVDVMELTSEPLNDQRVAVMVTDLVLRVVAAVLRA